MPGISSTSVESDSPYCTTLSANRACCICAPVPPHRIDPISRHVVHGESGTASRKVHHVTSTRDGKQADNTKLAHLSGRCTAESVVEPLKKRPKPQLKYLGFRLYPNTPRGATPHSEKHVSRNTVKQISRMSKMMAAKTPKPDTTPHLQRDSEQYPAWCLTMKGDLTQKRKCTCRCLHARGWTRQFAREGRAKVVLYSNRNAGRECLKSTGHRPSDRKTAKIPLSLLYVPPAERSAR